MKTWIQHIMFLRNDKQKVVADSYPYLCVHGILGGSVECLYVQMLLYPFEEQLNLPSLPVQLGNGQCLKLKVVGEETVNCICAEVFIHNKSKRIGILLGGEWSCQFDCFIREKSGRLVCLSTIKNFVKHIFFCSCYKKGITVAPAGGSHREPSRAHCASMAVRAMVLMMSCTRAPRDRSFTGLLRPCSTGPMAKAPEERCTAL